MKIFQTMIVICLGLLCVSAAVSAQVNDFCDESDEILLYTADLSTLRSQIYEQPSQFVVSEDIPIENPAGSDQCTAQGRLKITFPSAVGGVQNYRLRATFTLMQPNSLSGHSFHIGDSPATTGAWGSSNAVEMLSLDDEWVLHTRSASFVNQQQLASQKIEVTLGDEYINIENGDPQQQVIETGSDLFVLRGQMPQVGPAQYDIFIGMNRLIPDVSGGVGTGLCSIEVKALRC